MVQIVLGWVELKLFQEGLCWVRLCCDGWVKLSSVALSWVRLGWVGLLMVLLV